MIFLIVGDIFLWGKYINIYVIRDVVNSLVFCFFNIYVMRK